MLLIGATQALVRPRGILAIALAAATPAFLAPPGQAVTTSRARRARPSARRAPVIRDARCVPASACTAGPHQVQTGGRLQLSGVRLRPGMRVIFPARRATTGRAPRPRSARSRTVSARLRRSRGRLVVVVPRGAGSGRIVVTAGRRRSRPFGPITVVRAIRKRATPPAVPGASGSPSGSAFDGAGMWIWYVSKSDGGSPDAIGARAKAAGIGTVFVKSGDGPSNYWSQFSSDFVSALKSRGLKVCAWQYVYGRQPEAEADLGARAVQTGADCLVIDAESEYEGRYAEAQRYIRKLRGDVGPDYPIGLASFPYVDYHPTLPYSVFLGPGGAQFNAPQMYWKAIGTSVDNVYAHTWTHNRIYGRGVFPLGQTYQDPPPTDIARFRSLAQGYGFTGLSWWDWQETSQPTWDALSAPASAPAGFTASGAYPNLGPGSKGDEVIWLQQHLASANSSTPINGSFDAATEQSLTSFQSSKGLQPSGRTDPATWQAVLALALTPVDWTGGGGSGNAGGGSTGGSGSTGATGPSGASAQ